MGQRIDSSDNGHATDHHFVHIGSMVMRGWGLLMIEATAVVPEGRISPEDSVSCPTIPSEHNMIKICLH